MYKLIVSVALAMMLVLGGSQANATSIPPDTITLINKARSEGRYCGGVWYPPAKPLKQSSRLKRSSYNHSKKMANSGFGHSNLKRSMRSVNYRYRYAGENIAAGFAVPEKVVLAWLNSPGHCKILMSGKYVHIGIGFYYKADSRWKQYWTMQVAKPTT